MDKLKKYIKLISFNIVLTLLLLFLIELVLSFVVEREIGHNISPHPVLNHVMIPNTTKEFKRFAESNPRFPKPFIHQYNSQGWAETNDIIEKKPTNTYRIFYVGDSFVEGAVSMEENLPSQVKRFLKEKYANAPIKFEIINAGTTSYSPILYYILIRHYISKFDPDLIVISVDMTDDYDDDKYRETLKVDKEGNPLAAPPRNIFKSDYVDTETGKVAMGWRERTHLWLYLHSNFYYLTVPNLQQILGSTNSVPELDRSKFYHRWQWVKKEWDEPTTENVAFSMDVLGRIADYCNENDIKLLLTGVPHHLQMQYEENCDRKWSKRPHEEIEKVAKEKGVAYFDGVDALEPYVNGSEHTKYYYHHDMHFNPEGYVIWADAHINALQDTTLNLLPKI